MLSCRLLCVSYVFVCYAICSCMFLGVPVISYNPPFKHSVMFDRCLGGVGDVFRMLCGGLRESVLDTFGTCLGGSWGLIGICLHSLQDIVWKNNTIMNQLKQLLRHVKSQAVYWKCGIRFLRVSIFSSALCSPLRGPI